MRLLYLHFHLLCENFFRNLLYPLMLKKWKPQFLKITLLLLLSVSVTFLKANGPTTHEPCDACDNVINGGQIQADESGCPMPTWDPSIITSAVLPVGGSGALEFIWIFTTDDPLQPLAQWTPIPNSNSPDYDPAPISVTTHYRRCARRAGCIDYIGESNIITKSVNCCDNVTDGGQIGTDQHYCGSSFDPNPIVNVTYPSGGSGGLEYQWFMSLTGTPYMPGSADWALVPGAVAEGYDVGSIVQTTYFVRLARRDGCTDYLGVSNMITLSVFEAVDVNLATSGVTCAGGSDGAIDITVMAGESPFGFQWDPAQGNTEDLQAITAGFYQVTVTDANGCTATVSVDIPDGDTIVVTADHTVESCLGANNGSAQVFSVSGGVPNYTYFWDDPFFQTTSAISGLSPGTYTVVATDAQGCTGSASVILENGPMLQVQTMTQGVQCFGGNDGTATVVSVTGGSGTYFYQWNDPALQMTQTVFGLTAGNFEVIVNDDQGCVGVGSAVVEDGIPLVLSLSHTNAQCGTTADGTATVTVSGGVPPYSYLWNDPAAQTSSTAGFLAAGNYSVTVMDANGCTAVGNETVQAPMSAMIETSATDVNCAGASDGSVSVTVQNGDPATFSYLWNDPAASTGMVVNGLPGGTFSVTVSDQNGCMVVASATISEPTPLLLSMQSTSASCFDSSDGAATVTVSGGTPFGNGDYQYNWNAPGNPAVASLDDISAGVYTVTVTDANGCSSIGMLAIDAPAAMVVNMTNTPVTCSGFADGAALANVQGGTGPYTYLWDDPSNSTTADIADLGPGVYTLTVTDVNGCTTISQATIFEPPALVLTFNKTDILCYDDNDGTVTVQVTGGVTPYLYAWSGGETTATITGLTAGNFETTVTDANGCVIGGSATIFATTTLAASVSATDANCSNSSDGQATVTGQGGSLPYTYSWSNGATTAINTNLLPGAYTVTVTDSDGCSVSSTVQVGAPPQMTCQTQLVAPITIYGGSNGSASVTAGGGVAPYTYAWASGATSQTASNLAAGVQNVTVTDSHSCTCVTQITMTNPSKIGNFVWQDINQNGIQDTGEPGIQNITVHLLGTTNTGAPINMTDVTDLDGQYDFDGLLPGFYHIEVDLLPNHIFTLADIGNDALDSDIHPATGSSDTFLLAPAYFDNRWDAGIIILDEKINIGDFVWQDADHNGIQDLNENGLSGIPVKLISMPGNTIVASTTTNLLGKYLFPDVMPGTYLVEFSLGTLPNGYIFAPQNQGSDDEKDSDPDPATGRTAQFQVLPFTVDNLSIDAGIFKECDNVTDGGLIGFDEDLCGIGADPAEIVSVAAPTGGFGVLEYLWLSSNVPVYNGPGDPNWTPIPNSNNASYDPGPITQTTYYIRCSRRLGCVDYPGETNIVAKNITPYPLTQIIDSPNELCELEDGRFEAAIAGGGATYFWEFGPDATPQTATTRVVDPVHWSTQGLKTVKLTVTRFGCSFSVTKNVQVNNCGNNLVVFENILATLDGDKIDINWKVSGEASKTVFFVQRSEDGRKFENLNALAGVENQDSSSYHFTDHQPKLGANLYRILFRQMDENKEEGYSSVVSVFYRPENIGLVQVYPNPTFGRVVVELLKPNDSPASVKITSPFGKILESMEMPAQTEKLELDLSRYPQGVYLVCIKQNGYREQVCRIAKVD